MNLQEPSYKLHFYTKCGLNVVSTTLKVTTQTFFDFNKNKHKIYHRINNKIHEQRIFWVTINILAYKKNCLQDIVRFFLIIK
jgi:hypothetical protein